jgi:hypothetical protein
MHVLSLGSPFSVRPGVLQCFSAVVYVLSASAEDSVRAGCTRASEREGAFE